MHVPADLDTHLFQLFRRLRASSSKFEEAPDGGRPEAIRALRATLAFLVDAFPDVVDAGNLQQPLAHLLDALVALDTGHKSALLEPKKKRGRAIESPGFRNAMGMVAAFVHLLMKYGIDDAASRGDLTRVKDVRGRVAKVAREVGLRPARGSGEMTERTVREWCERVAAAPKSAPERVMYDQLIESAHPGEMDGAEQLKTLALLKMMLQSMAAEKLQNPSRT